jgi:hypothetical protein
MARKTTMSTSTARSRIWVFDKALTLTVPAQADTWREAPLSEGLSLTVSACRHNRDSSDPRPRGVSQVYEF